MSWPKGSKLAKEPGLNAWSILVGYRGSVAHGTYRPNTDPNSIDDKDVIGICVPPLEYYFGLKEYGSRGTVEVIDDPWDAVVYESRKALRLLSKSNPNILSLLWLPENLYIKVTESGRLILENREAFVSRSAFYPFMGYARSQLTKMERGKFEGYMGEKRKALVKKHGYDTKNASHLIRLLRMGIEFLIDGELKVVRHDAAELLAIKDGEWSIERVKKEADKLFALAEESHIKSTLPKEPNWELINELAVNIAQLES